MIDPSCCRENQDAARLRALEDENTRLQHLIAELLMKNQLLRERLSRAEASSKTPEAFDLTHSTPSRLESKF